MKIEKWKTTVLGVGPWIVSDVDYPQIVLGTFRKEEHADLFVEALEMEKPPPNHPGEGAERKEK